MKINKKTTLAVSGVLVIGALAATLGTMSYFTDTESKTNVFTVGDVNITLLDQQRYIDPDTGCKSQDANQLVDFDNNQAFQPLIGHDANGGVVENGVQSAKKDTLSMPAQYGCEFTNITARTGYVDNYIDKMVAVKNEGANEAYVRVYLAIPTALLDSDPSDADLSQSFNPLHIGNGSEPAGTTTGAGFIYRDISAGYTIADQDTGVWNWTDGATTNAAGKLTVTNYKAVTIDGIPYALYYADYVKVENNTIVNNTLAGGETTARMLDGLYLDSRLEVRTSSTDSTKRTLWMKGSNGQYYDTTWDAEAKINIPVAAIAVQATGFTNMDEAITAAYGADFNPFANLEFED